MTKKLYAEGVTGHVAIYEGGNEAAFTDPLNNLDKVYFHSALDYISIAHVWQGTITHPARTRSGSEDKYLSGAKKPLNGTQDYALTTHNLGYVPKGIARSGNDMLPAMAAVQRVGAASSRFVSFLITSTSVTLRENWFTFEDSLPAVNVVYTIYLFSPLIVGSGNKTLYIDPTDFKASKGKLDITRRYIKSKATSPDFFLAKGPSADVAGGGMRIVTPAGVSIDDGRYTGSFAGTPAKGCSV